MGRWLARPGADLQRNVEEYSSFWSHRFRRRWNYPSQSKLKHFRAMMSAQGWLRKEGLSVFDQGFGLGLMLFCFRKSCSLAGLELSPAVVAAAADARALGYQNLELRTFELACPFPSEWKSRFDVLISSHVLEHLEDPANALTELGQLLKDSGVASRGADPRGTRRGPQSFLLIHAGRFPRIGASVRPGAG